MEEKTSPPPLVTLDTKFLLILQRLDVHGSRVRAEPAAKNLCWRHLERVRRATCRRQSKGSQVTELKLFWEFWYIWIYVTLAVRIFICLSIFFHCLPPPIQGLADGRPAPKLNIKYWNIDLLKYWNIEFVPTYWYFKECGREKHYVTDYVNEFFLSSFDFHWNMILLN